MSELAFKNNSNSTSSDLEANDLGRPNTFRFNILSFVINEEYDRAIQSLKDYIESDSEYPNFRVKIERYALHAIDLIYAIRTKRNFPGLSALTRTKQQELKDKFREHFKELRTVLKKIEFAIEELRISDAKSTRIVVRSFWLTILSVFTVAFVLEFFNGLGYSISVAVDDKVELLLNWIFSKIL